MSDRGDATPDFGKAKPGEYYWCIKTRCATDGRIYLYAERLEVTQAGALIAWGPGVANLMLAPGQWSAAYRASAYEHSALAIEHWAGELLPAG